MELSISTAGGSPSQLRVPHLPSRAGSCDTNEPDGVSSRDPAARQEDVGMKLGSDTHGGSCTAPSEACGCDARGLGHAPAPAPMTWCPQNAAQQGRAKPGSSVAGPSKPPSCPAECTVVVANTAPAAEPQLLVDSLLKRGYSAALVSGELAEALAPRPGRVSPHVLVVPAVAESSLLRRAREAVATASSFRQRRPALAVVVVSALNDASEEVAWREAGVDRIIRLPLSSDDLDKVWTYAACETPSRFPARDNQAAWTGGPVLSEMPNMLAHLGSTASSFRPSHDGQAFMPCSNMDTVNCGLPEKPLRLLDWLPHWQQRPQLSDCSGKDGLHIFYNVLTYVHQHHMKHSKPWGAAILRSFVVHESNKVVCCPTQWPQRARVGVDSEEDVELFLAPEGAHMSKGSDMFLLGCLLFQLLQPPRPQAAAREAMCDLRNRILPLDFLQQRPMEAALVLSMMHPSPFQRPSADQVASNAIFADIRLMEDLANPKPAQQVPGHTSVAADDAEKANAADTKKMEAEPSFLQALEDPSLNLDRAEVVTDVLLDFLRTLRDNLAKAYSVERQQCHSMSGDLMKVVQALGKGKAVRFKETPNISKAGNRLKRKRHTCPGAPGAGFLDPISQNQKPALRKVKTKLKLDMFSCIEPEEPEEDEAKDKSSECHSAFGPELQEQASQERWRRLEGQFPTMENMYLQRLKDSHAGLASPGPLAAQRRMPSGLRWSGLPGHLCSFAEDLGKFSRYGSLATHASLVQTASGSASQMISSMSFGCGDEMFATAGTATRKIKLYQVQPLLQRGSTEAVVSSRLSSAAHYPLLEMETESKLSSISWNQYLRNYLVSAEYNGSVSLWDTAKGELITSFSEHAKRTWTVDCSAIDPKRMLSAGDDSTLRIWSVSDPCSSAVIKSCAPIYSARFSPADANLVAVGCANYRTFLYDLRNTATPVTQICGHKKAVSYVQFMGGHQLVTASIDSTVKLWDLPGAAGSGQQPRLKCCFQDHTNEKIFVGLAVREDGYILCGSETNEVHCYYSGLPVSILKHDFADSNALGGRRPQASSICWSATSNLFLAANTAGRVDLLEMSTS